MGRGGVFPPFVYRAHALIWSRKYWILTLYFVTVWLAVLFFLQAKPVYEVTATVSIKPAPLFSADVGRIAAERPEQFARPQITLLESETVIRRAIAVVGEERLYQAAAKNPGRLETAMTWLRSGIKYLNPGLSAEMSPADSAYANVRNSLTIRSEPQTDIILIAFKSPNPDVAVDFTNALVQSFSRRYFEIYGNTGAVGFFSDQKLKSERALSEASTKLAEYSSKYSLFSLDEQRRLLLQQRSALSAALLVTRGSIADKAGQVAAISKQMEQMKQPMARSPQLKGLTDQKAPADQKTGDNQQGPAAKSVFDDPPMLLVRVYQDTVANLVRINAEIAGLTALETEQKNSLKDIENELALMAGREAEINELHISVSESKGNVEVFSKKAFEEQLAQDLNERKFSPVQTLQEATRPLKPLWPRPGLLLALGAALCLVPLLALLGIHNAIMGEARDAPMNREPPPRPIMLEHESSVRAAHNRALG